jgi:hypothetical protein
MPPPADPDQLAHEIRSAVTAASARIQLTARRLERGVVDPARLLRELRDLDRQVRRVLATLPAPDATKHGGDGGSDAP